MKRRNLQLVLFVMSVLFIFSLACKQSGEIVTPAEATQRFEATQAVKSGEVVNVVEGAEYSPGDEAILTSEGYLVGLFKEADGKNAYSYATRGDKVIVMGSIVIEGEFWYKIESTAGNGWLPASNLDPVE
jgi:hypothetical protein